MDTADFEQVKSIGHQRLATVPDDLLQHAVRIAMELTQAECAHLVLLDAAGGARDHAGLDRLGNVLPEPVGQSIESIHRQVLASGKPSLLTHSYSTIRAHAARSPEPRSLMCLPIVARGRVLGALHVERLCEAGVFTQEDLKHSESLALLLATALDNAPVAEPLEGAAALRLQERDYPGGRRQGQLPERSEAVELSAFRLELWEYAASQPLEAVMQKALDEICGITASPIGFYHFVADDQRTISLQAWSSRTLAEFCTAQGKGLHYNIDQAGVWVDAFYQQKAVIHNDYASLPHRKGLPQGHAEVIRQLVVPVLREGRVVSILGVGNKSTDYDEHDVNLVSTIADLVWAVVDHKRAEEQIRRLNARLESLAMTDDLTGILNRRSFFERGKEQFAHFLRYQTPFSLLALDIDGFKKVNDAHGHDAGDQFLKCFTAILQRNIRSTDILARVGGEEFCIILPHTSQVSAAAVAEKLRQAVQDQGCFISEHHTLHRTVSIGVAAAGTATESFEALVKDADRALYRAKHQGRNLVVLHGER